MFCGACGNNRTNRGGFQFAAARLPWFIAEQDNRYIEVVSLLSKASESGEQHVDIFINMFEDPIDDIISRNIEPKTFATLYKYIERIPFTPDVKKEFLSSIETINFS
ncbi:hypothetical protein [Escherichia coli]|uniref:hypothetical protein n=1 Tax=Escherichia coli TaxID=562 RepID=UPI00201E9742|nr:hypothetical protein [Escherichia coli]